MDVNNLLPEDDHQFDDECDHDDAEYVYHSDQGGEENMTYSEDEQDNNHPGVGQGMDEVSDFGSDSSANYNTNTDSENELQLPLPPRPNRKRGMTRLPRLRTEYSRSGGKKTCKV
jgi:hypothetical protein